MEQIEIIQEYDILCVYVEYYPSYTQHQVHDQAINECKNQAVAFHDNGVVMMGLTLNGIKVSGYFERRYIDITVPKYTDAIVRMEIDWAEYKDHDDLINELLTGVERIKMIKWGMIWFFYDTVSNAERNTVWDRIAATKILKRFKK